MSIEPTSIHDWSVAMTARLADRASDHLLFHVRRDERQEQLCFGLWRPSDGLVRTSALLFDLLLPGQGEVELDGNVSFTGPFLERAMAEARRHGAGLALLHNHFGPGWQGMSKDDIAAELRIAPSVLTATDRPLLGMTLGTDRAWSARLWPRVAPKTYQRQWCSSVRVAGEALAQTFHPEMLARAAATSSQVRTASAWGSDAQQILASAHVGVVGLGSVGRLVSEGLARMGVRRVTFIDHDVVEEHNLDRLIGAVAHDAAQRRPKVDLAQEGFLSAATAERAECRALRTSLCTEQGFAAAVDCDVLFSCVDRPWPRRVLNHIAYAHLIPVIDGGILVRTRAGQFRGAEWSTRTCGPGRACLACCGSFDPADVDADRRGVRDDQSYIDGLPEGHALRQRQNVLPFCMGLASAELLQYVALVTSLLRMPNLGEQRFHYNLREVKVEDTACRAHCEFAAMEASGETVLRREQLW